MQLVVGHVTHDRTADGVVPGGSAYYAARIYRRLGGTPHLATAVGEDFAFDERLAELSHSAVRHGNTTLFTNIYPDNSPRLQLVEAWAPMVRPEMLEASLLESELVHLAPVLGEIELAEWVEAIETDLLAISVQGWVRAPDPSAGARRPDVVVPEGADLVASQHWGVEAELLEEIDVAFASGEDLRGLEVLRAKMFERIPIVAVTRGRGGATLSVDGRRFEIGIYETDVADATGAGDAFAAGMLSRLADGFDPVLAARFGAAVASVVVEAPGTAAIERIAEAERRLSDIEVRSR